MNVIPAYRYIVVEGNIGAGKTSLVNKLAADFKVNPILEEFEDNSFLPKFYEDARRYAFPLEMSFLAARFNQLKNKLSENDLFNNIILSDYMFPKCLLFSKINLDDDEYELYIKLFEIINLQLNPPDLLVYLHNPVEKLLWNIANRGRSYEQQIEGDYLEHLNKSYLDYFKSNPQLRILIIDCANIDFAKNENHYLNMRSIICKEYQPGIHHINWLIE